jgi:hypothetical protein
MESNQRRYTGSRSRREEVARRQELKKRAQKVRFIKGAARVGAIVLAAGLISGIASYHNEHKDDSLRNQIEATVRTYDSVSDFLQHYNDVLDIDNIDAVESMLEAEKLYNDNKGVFGNASDRQQAEEEIRTNTYEYYDAYLTTVKIKIAEAMGLENPNRIQISVHYEKADGSSCYIISYEGKNILHTDDIDQDLKDQIENVCEIQNGNLKPGRIEKLNNDYKQLINSSGVFDKETGKFNLVYLDKEMQEDKDI